MNFGPLMISIYGLELTAEDRNILCHPLIGGVILFARNYYDKAQVTALCTQIRLACPRPLLIAVDQEGGRVQRFGAPFTRIPAMRHFGRLYDSNPDQALSLSVDTGSLLATELCEVGVDFSFAPVLDLDRGLSEVIGDRAFHRDPSVVVALAGAFIKGLRRAGMTAVVKHYPGHGGVVTDSHIDLPIDRRECRVILREDLEPFRQLIGMGVGGVMPAHVAYTDINPLPAGFSSYWLKVLLRDELGFDGAVFSDDLGMRAAHSGGGPIERAVAAATAGCDMLLLCNERDTLKILLSEYRDFTSGPTRQRRLEIMRARRW